MSELKWDGSLETGFEAVDNQHRTLIRIFSEFQEGLRNECDRHTVGELLVDLCDYVATHFAAEEALMERFRYPEIPAASHKEEHRLLSERTRELALAHGAGQEAAFELASLLRGWLIDHISNIDRQLVAHIKVVTATEN